MKPKKLTPEGSAKYLGRVFGEGSGVWLLLADYRDLTGWKGYLGKPNDDFARALRVTPSRNGAIRVGKGKGCLINASESSSWTHVWQVPGGIALWCISPPEDEEHDLKDAKTIKALAPRVLGIPLLAKGARRTGRLKLSSGCLALSQPGASGDIPQKWRDKATRSPGSLLAVDDERWLIGLPKGEYDVLFEIYGPKKNPSDEFAEYHYRIKIVRKETT